MSVPTSSAAIVLGAILLLIVAPPQALAQGDCSPVFRNPLGQSVQGISNNFSLHGNLADGIIDGAIANWANGCPGSDLPDITRGSSGLSIQVVYHSGASPNGSCGRTDVHEIPASNPDFVNQVGPNTVINLYESGSQGACNLTDTLTHELGHLLGEGDGLGSCLFHIMGPPIPYRTRAIFGDDCAQAESANQDPAHLPPCPPAGGGTTPSSIDHPPDLGFGFSTTKAEWTAFGSAIASPKVVGSGGGTYYCRGADGQVYQVACPDSPIVIDLGPRGFRFTGLDEGVYFDLNADGQPDWTAWTKEDADDAFLVLDRDGNGLIDNGLELFGNFTSQPPSIEPNGYEALAVFDLPENGGTADGLISAEDAIFSDLLLWIDDNHDGISDADELYEPGSFDIVAFDLVYHESWRQDQHGNLLRYLGKAYREHPPSLRTTDVFFLSLIRPE